MVQNRETTRLRAVRIKRKSHQKTTQTLGTTEPTLVFRIENQKRKESENQELDENSKSTLERACPLVVEKVSSDFQLSPTQV